MSCRHSWCPFMRANIAGVNPMRFLGLGVTAYCSSSATMSTWPLHALACSGLSPRWSTTSSTYPSSTSARNMAQSMRLVAHAENNGVRPMLSRSENVAWDWNKCNSTSREHAKCAAVWPALLMASTSAAVCSSSCRHSVCPLHAAACRGVSPR